MLACTVPEPSTCAIALAGLACSGYSLFRHVSTSSSRRVPHRNAQFTTGPLASRRSGDKSEARHRGRQRTSFDVHAGTGACSRNTRRMGSALSGSVLGVARGGWTRSRERPWAPRPV